MSSPILSYQKRTSLIHKTPALLKLALLLGIAIALYLTGFGVHCLLMVVALLLVWVSKIQLKDFLGLLYSTASSLLLSKPLDLCCMEVSSSYPSGMVLGRTMAPYSLSPVL